MNMFFRLIHNDMYGICLVRLNEVRAPGEDDFFNLFISFFCDILIFFWCHKFTFNLIFFYKLNALL